MLCRVQPILDGFGAVRILRARGVTIPIIAVTAAATLEVRNQCLAAGMSRYVGKATQRTVVAERKLLPHSSLHVFFCTCVAS